NGDLLESLAYLEASGERYGSYSWTIDGKNSGHGRKISNTLSLVPGSHNVQLDVDYLGNISTTSVSFSILEPVQRVVQTGETSDGILDEVSEKPQPALSIKQPSDTVYTGPVRFEANLTNPDGMSVLQGGVWKWTVSDSMMRQEERNLESRTGTMDLSIPGDYLIVCTYEHPELDKQLLIAKSLKVDPFADAVLDVNFAQTVYQHGQPLQVEVRANDATGHSLGIDEIQWSINGVKVDAADLVAPYASGEHTLQGVLVSQGIEVDRSSVTFVSNQAPQVRIVEPLAGKIVTTTDDFIARCVVTDDQAVPEDSIVWLLDDAPVASGSSVILGGLESGKHTLRVTATDVYGLSNEQSDTSRVGLQAYAPVEILRVVVNQGYEKHLFGSGDLSLMVEYEGGLDPAIVWTIRQGEMEILESGAVVSLPDSLFKPGSASVSLLVFDNDTTIMTNSYQVQLIQSTSSEVISPLPYQSYPIGHSIPVVIRWLGESIPAISMELNGQSVPLEIDSKKLDVGFEITCTLDQSFARLGANALTLDINGSVSHIPLDVTQWGGSITFNATPSTVDGTTPASVASVVQATVLTGRNIREMVWTSNRIPDPIASGTSINLAACNLEQGEHWITLHVTTYNGEKFQQGFATTVLAPIEASIASPLSKDQTRLVVQPTEQVAVYLDGRDRDGGAFTNDQVRWISSQMGFVNEGLHLDLRKISDGAVHEVTAVVTSRHSATAMRKLEIVIAQPEIIELKPEEAEPATPAEIVEEGTADQSEGRIEESVEQPKPEDAKFSEAQSLESLLSSESSPIAVVLSTKGKIEIRQNNRTVRVSVGDNLMEGGKITIPRNGYLELFYVNNAEPLVVYADRGTYEWDSFSETWK
ncbi:MAG: hypothetical protein VB056_03590, partial [Sphaerochaeta associata]|uniref:hypothetical protein n=1 Tax=Sphaerochaeta associata TaxID=1129264 RepID=UPI002B202EA5